MNNIEQTLSIIKPDAVERNLIEEIKLIFKKNDLRIKNDKKIHISKEEAAEFYNDHQSKPFYDDLCNYLSSGPIVVMILEGKDAVIKNRKIMGATDPKNADENTIRKLYGISIDKNSVHGSDSSENAKKERKGCQNCQDHARAFYCEDKNAQEARERMKGSPPREICWIKIG